MKQLTELRNLVARMTPGDWTLQLQEEIGMDGEREGLNISIEEIGRSLHDAEWAEAEDWDRDFANASGIVALRNNAEAMLDVIMAAQTLVDSWPSVQCTCRACDKNNALRAALAKLERPAA